MVVLRRVALFVLVVFCASVESYERMARAGTRLSGTQDLVEGYFEDDFSDCQNTVLLQQKWTLQSKQWGGDLNGGVVPGNVQCVFDNELQRTVLSLQAHGDIFTGSEPKAVVADANLTGDYTLRGANQEWTSRWTGANYGYNATCSPHCDVRRVGSAVSSRTAFTGGRFEIWMKPCENFGAVSALWTYNYTERKQLP